MPQHQVMTEPYDPVTLIGELQLRLDSLERTAWRPVVGMGYPWFGTAPATFGGEVEVEPGFLLANGAEVSIAIWPELYAKLGLLYGTPSQSGLIRLPSALGRVLVGKDTSGALSNIGATGGQQTISITGANLAHEHDMPGGTEMAAGPDIRSQTGGVEGFTTLVKNTMPPYLVITAWTVYAGRKVMAA